MLLPWACANPTDALRPVLDTLRADISAAFSSLAAEIRQGNETLPIFIFCIAYGRDADYNVLDTLAEASGGQVREGNTETIRELYKILSSYF